MADKNKKQFGVWMDTHDATIVGKDDSDKEEFTIIGHVSNTGHDNSSGRHSNSNQEIALTTKFFKDIAAKMPNIDEIHITGTGQIQEEFIHFLAETPQYKNARSSASTANRMSDEELSGFITKHFN
ncbi:MAG: hypothetical protein M3Q97_00250 [Bacteroidota bacterium]|nr:hypothetical protein [Bacteroidota bacterium]